MIIWLVYDIGYIERYMSILVENFIGYKMSFVLNYVNRFLDE